VEVPALVDEQVGGLDVAMDDVVAVSAVQCLAGLPQPGTCSMTMNGRPSCSPMS
jgi:hypothetical protein